jgi:putative sigma-54 modulation protein
MNINYNGRHIELTESLKLYIRDKISRLQKFHDGIRRADVVLTVEKNRSIEDSQRVEVTLFLNGSLIRSEEASISMYSSIDLVVEKLERRIKKFKTKIAKRVRRDQRKHAEVIASELPPELPVEEEEPAEAQIVREKAVPLVSMTPDEAALEMELLGHDFHLFKSLDEQISVVYRRKDGNYGLLSVTS